MKLLNLIITGFILFSTHTNCFEGCEELKPKIGQMIHLSVDGFGSEEIIDPYYFKMIEEIQPGGVLPRFVYKSEYGGAPPFQLRENDIPLYNNINKHLTGLVEIPPFLARDAFDYPTRRYSGSYSMFNTGEGPCELALSHQNAFQEIGLNQIFGPILEAAFEDLSTSDKEAFLRKYLDTFENLDGVQLVLKHFPYTVQDKFDLHSRSIDVPKPIDAVIRDNLSLYKDKGNEVGMVMTSHLFNSSVDNEYLVTFSETWVSVLRNEIGFGGVIIADALDMIARFPKNEVRIKNKNIGYDPKKVHELSHYAIQSIMAGHNMFILQTPSRESLRVFRELSKFACQDSEEAKFFRGRIEESYSKIINLKKRKGLLP